MGETKHQRRMRTIKISFVMLLSIMLILSHLPPFAKANVQMQGKIYFVAPWGQDTNDGSEKSPWRTIQFAANKVQAGDTVMARGGTYKENITIKASGSAAQGYITIQAYPGETPVISGAGSKSSSLVQFYGAHYIVFDGFELTDFIVTDSSKYISAIKVIEASSNLIIQNNHIHHIEHRASKASANGIIVYGNNKKAITNINIANNYLHDLILGTSEALTVVGNVDGFSIENNVIERVNNIGIDVAGFYGTCPSGCIDQARNGIVVGNDVSYVDTINNPVYRGYRAAAAIYVDGGRDTIIERNTVSYSNYGIEVASEKLKSAATGIIVRNNYIHHNHMSGLIMGGSSSSNGGASDNYILNNTFTSNNELRTGDGEITFQNHVKNNVFANNLFVTNKETPYVYDNKTTNSGNILDYNLYYADDAPHSYWRLGGVRYTTLEQFQGATKQDLNSIVADPMLNTKVDGEIKLDMTSPAIDSGTLVYKKIGALDLISMDRIVGESVDLGAVEYVSEEQPPIQETPPPTPPPVIDPDDLPLEPNAPFTMDGLVEDWASYPALATGTSNVKEIKATMTEQALYVMLTGQLLKEKGQLYINSQQPSHTYFDVPHWSTNKADYLMENGVLYQYTGTGKNWSWSKVRDYRNKRAVISNNAVEISIPLAHLDSLDQQEILIGYIWKDSKANLLPVAGNMLSVAAEHAAAPETTPSPEPNPPSTPIPDQGAKPPIAIDGKQDDWTNISVWSKTSDSSVSASLVNDKQFLYVAITSTASIKKNQIFLNVDNDSSTGYQISKWKTLSGADFLIENGILYRYGGDGKTWLFNKITALDATSYQKSSSFIEMKLSLAELNLQPGDAISLGMMLNDQTALKLPQDAAFLEYTLSN